MKTEQQSEAFVSSEAWRHGNMGITKREYMATAILPAVIAATSAGQHHPNLDGMTLIQAMARDAISMADALLLQLAPALDADLEEASKAIRASGT